MHSVGGNVGKWLNGIALALLLWIAGLPAVAWAQSRLPASDEPGRIERRFPSPAEALKDPYAPEYSPPLERGACCLPVIVKEKPENEPPQPDIILLPPEPKPTEGESKQ